ncbi:MAG: hypothetical protein HC923_08695, partial [Myxococcales bacterium]|nr:hypothetical protein [Myxococcales bacterium]
MSIEGVLQIEQAADAQEAAVEETASLMADINASIRRIRTDPNMNATEKANALRPPLHDAQPDRPAGDGDR